MKKSFLFTCLIGLVTGLAGLSGQNNMNIDFSPLSERKDVPKEAIYTNTDLSPAQRAGDLIAHLTFDEKLELTGGWKGFYFPGIARLGLRPVRMSDASQGIRLMASRKDGEVSTSFPCMLALASAWNPELAETFGENMGEECRALGIDILLGPGIDMYRTSEGGRNYEYMGEDPLLTSRISTAYITGLQSKKIIATAKHFILNDQEFCRHIVSCDADERTLREIYLPPWKSAIVNAGLKAVMTGNNLVNGIPCSMDKDLMQDILRDEYGFTGIAMTDWQNTCYHPKEQQLVLPSGESLLMPVNETFAGYIEAYLNDHPEKKKEIESQLEKMIYPNLLTLFEMGVYDRNPVDSSFIKTIEQHKAFAEKCADEAICLLKNQDNILPIPRGTTILLMGEPEIHSGQGSGFVKGYDHVDFSAGLEKVYGKNFTCKLAPSDEEIRNTGIVLYRLNKPAGEGHDVPFDEPKDAGEEIIRLARLNPNLIVIVSSGNGLDMSWLPDVKGVLWTYFLGQERGDALADIISGKVNPSGHLPFTIEKAFKDSPDPTFNYLGGKPYWQGDNKDYKEYWLGHETNSDKEIARYVKPGEIVHEPYKEGIFIGYRWYEKNHIPVRFPFGYGLSYTTFRFKGLKLSASSILGEETLNVEFTITNSGKMAGAAVPQLYIRDVESGVERPVKELKDFKKLWLKAGETRTVEFTIDRDDLSFWDTVSKSWKAEPGKFEVLIGSSSADIELSSGFELK